LIEKLVRNLTGKLRAPLRDEQMHAILNVLNRRMMAFALEVLMDPNKSIESTTARRRATRA
jgi:hypothetical protein